jgi:hypothetical protein
MNKQAEIEFYLLLVGKGQNIHSASPSFRESTMKARTVKEARIRADMEAAKLNMDIVILCLK